MGRNPRSETKLGGFSLLELLLVLALVGILTSVAVAGYSAMMQSAALDSASSLVEDALNEARQDAATKNITVEVRFYAVPGQGQTGLVYQVLQLHWLNADGTTPAISRPLSLPSTVVIDATASHSSLIGASCDTATPDPTDSRLNSQTRVVRFLADGSTDLTATQSWCLTLRAASQSDPNHFPANWFCLTLDPVTSRVQILRP
jgi:uncharacterized protein (TIGR02596 family)